MPQEGSDELHFTRSYSNIIQVRWVSLHFSGVTFCRNSVLQKLLKSIHFFTELFKI